MSGSEMTVLKPEVVTDNASNYKAAGRILMERRPTLFWTPCAAHCIDLMLEDIGKLRQNKMVIKKARMITNFIYRHTRLLDAVRSTIGGDLVRHSVTRFATSFLTLQSVLKHEEKLKLFFVSPSWNAANLAKTEAGKQVVEVILSTVFWNGVRDCLKGGKPLMAVLRLVDGDERPAMPEVYVAMEEAKQRIKEHFDNKERLYKKIIDIVENRWTNQMEQKLYGAALFLNPSKYFEYEEKHNDDAWKFQDAFNDVIARLVPDQHLQDKIAEQGTNYKASRNSFGKPMAIRQRTTLNPMDWWGAHGGPNVELTKIALRILGLCCSSSSCERNWSTFEFATKTYIWLQCYEGSIQQVEQEVAMFCPMMCREILQTNMGYSKKFAIVLPQRVSPAILNLILDYCRFHQVRGRSNKERKFFDERFTKIDTKQLCELTSAADSLQLKPLVDLTSKVLARMIEGKTPEEIRDTFHLPDDLTEEEKLEPLKNTTDDPRIRLLNRLYARKRKELKKSQKLKNIEVEEKKDERSVDDLLSFINGDRDLKDAQSLRKKKNGRREDILRDPSNRSGKGPKERAVSLSITGIKTGGSASPSQMSRMQGQAEYAFNSRIILDDVDDGLDPVMKEELDREVEDFARRLNCDWPERMHEILSLSQERRLVTNLSVGNSSSQRCTGIDGRAR